MTHETLLKFLAPLLLGLAVLGLWEALCRWQDVPVFVLPKPSDIFLALLENFASLMSSLWATLRVTLLAFFTALVLGVALAALFSQSRLLELMLYPYAVVLQVTPVVAIAPLILIWVGFDRVELALLILATIVAFFPILSSATLGFRSIDTNQRDLFQLYRAGRWQKFRYLQFPSALPYLLNGMKVSAGLALIGAVVAEFVAGSGAATGLAWRIVESGNRLQIPKMFAALLLLSLLGIFLFFLLTWLEHLILRKWHESARNLTL
ncbi:MAG: ABC transporter permease [Alphaproteobacteria bacterium]|nr:MAG: ABC transporter permease [Alphaproteobacteria bacterium]